MPQKIPVTDDEYGPTDEVMGVLNYRGVQEALDECRREYRVRQRCFQRWIDDGRLAKTDAQDRLDRLATACKVLEQQLPPAQ